MVRRVILSGLIFTVVILSSAFFDSFAPGFDRAMERAKAYADAINRDFREPEKIYRFLRREVRSEISEEAFCEAFAKERSYPYITPLYIFYPELTIAPDGSEATAVFKQAARLEGMTYTVKFIYEDGDYFADDWRQFIDGSYLEKFENIPYSLSWYYDVAD